MKQVKEVARRREKYPDKIKNLPLSRGIISERWKTMFFKKVAKHIRDYWALHVMALPGVIAVFIFSYLPKFGVIVAFQRFNYKKGFFGSKFVGLDNFKFLFQTTDAWIITRNTVCYNAVMILLNTTLAVILAMILNEVKSKKLAKYIQTVYMMPHFLSATAVSMILFCFLADTNGLVNSLYRSLGWETRNWYMTKSIWPVTLVLVSSWMHVGYSSIIYLATITGISPEYYEAAMIDGANRIQQARYITLPHLRAILTIMLIRSIGSIFYGDFGLFYSVPRDSGSLFSVTNVIDTYIFRALKNEANYGMSSAAALYQSVVGFVLMIGANAVVTKISPEYAMF